ncbi:MAG: hypothetical protein V5A46_01200 [Haloferacaceae archaeon]
MMERSNCRKAGSAWAIGQGVLAALAPGVTARLVGKLIGKSFENASELEAKPAYLRQLRATGIGLIAAGVAGLLLEKRAEGDAEAE